ncbi:MAG: hypothetical protein QOJ12_274, partial [Thermoleophilales bacterium]|nr:hypothetical protein [Thermoleophilales bacterium]
WYTSLGDAVVDVRTPPPQDQPDTGGRRRALDCARRAVAEDDGASIGPTLSLLWASQHLDNLWRLEARLAEPAADAAASQLPG